jgi:hypothetical protein
MNLPLEDRRAKYARYLEREERMRDVAQSGLGRGDGVGDPYGDDGLVPSAEWLFEREEAGFFRGSANFPA